LLGEIFPILLGETSGVSISGDLCSIFTLVGVDMSDAMGDRATVEFNPNVCAVVLDLKEDFKDGCDDLRIIVESDFDGV